MSLIPPVVESSLSTAPPVPEPVPVSAPVSPAPRSAARRLIRALSLSLLLLLASVWSLVLIAWLTLHWGILPHIQDWRGRIESRVSQALGVPVRIGRIDVRSSGWVPSFELQEVTLQGQDGRTALRLPRVVAAISARSLLSLELDFAQLLIDGAELEMRRDVRGHLFVAGLDLGIPSADRPGGSSAAADWFFRQREFVIRGGSLRWIDEQRQAPALALDRVELVLRNTLRQHAFRLDATPPVDWGERFSLQGRFTQPLLARRGDWQRWSGSVYASLPRADVGQLRNYLTLPFDLTEGRGALRGWFEVDHGQPTTATVDLALKDVALRLDPGQGALAFSRIEGRLIGRRDKDGASLEAQRFGFDVGNGLHWPEGGVTFAWRQRAGQAATGGSFSADRLDIGLMAQVASRVTRGDAFRRLLDDLRPQGAATAVDVHWEGAVDAPVRYRVKAQLSGLSMAAKAAEVAGGIGRPGLRGASLQLDANEAGGSARLGLTRGAIELPGVFAEPLLPLDRLAAQLLWTIEPPSRSAAVSRITVQAKDVRFANADGHGEFDARWTRGSGEAVAADSRHPGRLELDGTLQDGVAARVYRYLPLALPGATRDYVQQAVRGGTLTRASFHIRGDLRDFPFIGVKAGGVKRLADKDTTASRGGEFRILAKAEAVSFAYIPGNASGPALWPMLTAASVELALDRGVLSIRNGRGRIGDIQWPKIDGAIDHFDSGAVLTLDAVARGPLDDMLRRVNATPVGGWIGKALDQATATGNAELKLALHLPLTHLDSGATVRGSVAVNDNDLRITPDSPLLGSAHGRVDFTEKGFAVAAAGAKVYGGDSTFDGGTQADGSVRFAAQGTVGADGLRKAPELGPVSRLAAALSGVAHYRMNLGIVHGRQEIAVSSNLVGMAIDLPPPLAKLADMPMTMRYQTALEPQPGTEAPHDLLQFELGHAVQARYLRELSGDSPRVVQGGVGVFAAAPSPARGVAAKVELKTLDLDAWHATLDRLFGPSPATSGANLPGSSDGGALPPVPASTPAHSSYEPDSIALRVQELNGDGRRLSHLTAGLSSDQGAWRANLDADQLAGYVEYRPANGATAAGGRVYARLSRLSLPKGDAEQVSNLLDSPQPTNVPALDVVVDDLVLNGLKLGRVEVQASNRSAGPLRDLRRDWQLTKFDITTPEAQLVGTGLWAATGVPALRTAASPRRMVLDFKLRVDDSGALLTRFGTSNVIRGGKGELSGQVAWVGSPFALDYPSLGGQVNVAIDAGQFLKAEPGAARLLGVLNLQSLPRRLSLDFRDVFDKGFAFDTITGDLKIAGGVAQTSNLSMRGVQASVSMQGSADIEKETQDLRVVVVPDVSAGTAALAYAVVNPVIGLGAFVAQAILKKPLTEAATREFRITGPWADPKVVPVARTAGADVPAVVPAVAPAASGAAKNP